MAADSFNLDPGPDPRAVAYLEAKGLKRSWRWSSMWGREHAFAFTLAGVHRLNVLAAGHDLVKQAVTQGETFETFQKGFEERLQKLGFAGVQTVTEFEDGSRQVNLSASSRMAVIYDTNVRGAYAASEWQAITDTAADFPALQYKHLDGQSNPRPEHVVFNGIVLPVGHPFWATHFPPNGYFCHCWTMQISVDQLANGEVKMTSQAELSGRGWSDDPDTWPIFHDRRTGRDEPVPPGISPGFGHNPGLVRRQNLADLLARRLDGLDPDMARAASADLVNFPQFTDLVATANGLGMARTELKAAEAARLMQTGMSRQQANAHAQQLADDTKPWPAESWPVATAPAEIRALAGDGSGVVVANASTIGHSADMHPTVAADWGKAQALLEDGEVWRGEAGDLVVFGRFADQAGKPQLWALALKPVAGAWRIRTLFPTSPRRRTRLVAGRSQVRGARGKLEF